MSSFLFGTELYGWELLEEGSSVHTRKLSVGKQSKETVNRGKLSKGTLSGHR